MKYIGEPINYNQLFIVSEKIIIVVKDKNFPNPLRSVIVPQKVIYINESLKHRLQRSAQEKWP